MSAVTAAPANRIVLADLIPGTRTRDLALVIAGALFMSLMAQVAITVPGSPVPITGQTLAVGLIGSTLGLRRGTSSMVLYVILGLFLPVYASGGSGFSVINGPAGGYVIGFIFATAVIGAMAERGASRRVVASFAAFVIAQLFVFAFGLVGLKLATGQTWAWTIHNGFTIFILGGVVKAVIGGLVLPAAWRGVRAVDEA